MLRKHLKEFDPFGVLERAVSPRWAHLLVRLGVIALLFVFLFFRITGYRNYLIKPLWAVETLIFAVFIISYAVRVDPAERSRGFREVVIPLIGAVLPFGLLLTPPLYWMIEDPVRARILFYCMTASTALTLWGLWTLRGSFSITVEARPPVLRGPYRWIRHPVYLGEILTAGLVTLWRWSRVNAAIFAVFVLIQLLRARWEEKKLARIYPSYRKYAARTFWFLKPPP